MGPDTEAAPSEASMVAAVNLRSASPNDRSALERLAQLEAVFRALAVAFG
jgi:hypothetical protein